MSSDPTPTPDPTPDPAPGGGVAAILAAVAGKITWERAILTVAALLAGALLHGYRQPPAATPVNLSVTAPAATQAVFGAEAEARGGRQGIAHAHFARVARHKVSEELQRSGLKAIGGSDKPIDPARADRVAEMLRDDAIHAVGQEHAPEFYKIAGDGGGGFLSAIVNAFKWLVQHPDVWVPILLKLLVLIAPLLA